MPRDPSPHQDDVVVCDVAGVAGNDLRTVEALARRHVAARRAGRTLRVRGASDELVGLLDLVGLADVLGLASGLEARGETEQREQPGGVEEGGDAGDAAV